MNDDSDQHKRRKIMALILAGCAVPLAFVLVFLGVCFGIAAGFELFMLAVVIAMGLMTFAIWIVVQYGDAPSDSDENP